MNKQYIILFSILALILASCQSSRRTATKEKAGGKTKIYIEKYERPEDLSDLQNSILDESERLLGTRYCYGGDTPDCFDCSGFVQTVFKSVGIEIPRISQDQFDSGLYISEKDKEPGDLIFFRNKKNISHVGIYVGNEQFIHASTSLGVIRQLVSDDYYRNKFAGYRRMIRNYYVKNR